MANPVRRDDMLLARYTDTVLGDVPARVAARMLLDAGATVREAAGRTGLRVDEVSELLRRMLRGL